MLMIVILLWRGYCSGVEKTQKRSEVQKLFDSVKDEAMEKCDPPIFFHYKFLVIVYKSVVNYSHNI